MPDSPDPVLLEALRSVRYPGFSRDIVSFGIVKEAVLEEGLARVQIVLTTNDQNIPKLIKTGCETVLREVPGVTATKVLIDVHAQAPTPTEGGAGAATKIEGVRHIIAVASGKGGVGKSTVASNLAAALARLGGATGLCDCDLYGPSVTLMFGGNERPFQDDAGRIVPIDRYGVKLMSMGFLLDDDAPAILRGPMVTRYTQQFLRHVAWGELDYLVLDLPPGTGDIQLTIVQTVALSGAVIVTTPQEVALLDARKAASMFERVNCPLFGIVENMSYFLCPSDGKRYDIFGSGGGKREAARLGVPLLAELPIDLAVREAGDRGQPVTLSEPDHAISQQYLELAKSISRACGA